MGAQAAVGRRAMRSSARRWGSSIEGALAMCLPKINRVYDSCNVGWIHPLVPGARKGSNAPEDLRAGRRELLQRTQRLPRTFASTYKMSPRLLLSQPSAVDLGASATPPAAPGQPSSRNPHRPRPIFCFAARQQFAGLPNAARADRQRAHDRPAAPSTGPRPPDAPPRARQGL